jgi:hypothetical protein
MKLFILGSYGARFVNAMKAGNVSFLGQTYANGSVFIQARLTHEYPIETISVKVHGGNIEDAMCDLFEQVMSKVGRERALIIADAFQRFVPVKPSSGRKQK